MKGINKAILIGHLGQDPDVRYTASGSAVTNISVATSEKWRDKQTNEQKEETQWHRVVFFGKLAEIAAEYLVKGSLVYIEGKIKTRKWEDKERITRYTTEIVCDGFDGQMQMLGGKEGTRPPAQKPAPAQTGFRDPPKQEAGTDWADDDEIPF